MNSLGFTFLTHITGRGGAASLATIVMERILDGVTLSLGLGLAWLIHPPSLPWGLGIVILGFGLAGSLGILILFWGSRFVTSAKRVLDKLPGHDHVSQLLAGFRASRAHFPVILGLSFPVWGLECFRFLGMLSAFHLPPDNALNFMAAANFASLVPAAPAGWGTVEQFTTEFLVQGGLDHGPVLAMVFSQHLLYFGITTSLGLVS